MITGFCSAWTGHTEDSRAFAEDMRAALMESAITHKAAWIMLGLANENQLSRQLAGTEPLNAYRLMFLPPVFHVAFLRRRAARLGAEVLTSEQLTVIRGAVALGRKRMARMFPSLLAERRIS